MFLASMLLMGCKSPTHSSDTDEAAEEPRSKASSEPSQFSVRVQLSPAALKKLDDSKETLVVAAYLTGRPKEGVTSQYRDIKTGDVGLGTTQQDMNPGQMAVFKTLNLNRDALSQIDSNGPQLLINVSSGRKSSTNNLLGCDVFEGSLQSVRGQTIDIHCKLIEEP